MISCFSIRRPLIQQFAPFFVIGAIGTDFLRADDINFNRDVRPLLSDRCFQCHGPDEAERKAKLRLDQATGPEGAFRVGKEVAAVKPGSPGQSAVWHRINSDDPEETMPPVDSHRKPLTEEERRIIKDWIEGGAEYQDFWAFVPPREPDAAKVRNEAWSSHPIDRFVLRKLESRNRIPKPRADRRTLIRRLKLDVTGLPPAPNEIHAFLNDKKPGAYERLVDSFLDSPQYGEHMAKYWLDLVRFADTNGIHHDHYRDMTPYRDWVIRSFNNNLRYDDFVKYQLAGDLYSKPSIDQLIASGFNRLHLIIDVGTALPEESHVRNVIDRVTSVGTAFMGLTVQCAVCHDHKYDPFTTRDFYQLYAFFNNIDAKPETGGRSGTDFLRGLQSPFINLPSPAQEKELAALNARIGNLDAELKAGKNSLDSEKDLSRKSILAKKRKTREQERKNLLKKRDKILLAMPAAMVMKERSKPRPAHILVRGAYDNPGERVTRATPSFLPAMRPAVPNTPTRMDLAKWFVAPDNPLTARVAVNRFWQQFFGVGIVKTSEDFGAQGEWPSHPDLLDHLTMYFTESDWDIKALIKYIVMSETYRQACEAGPEEYAKDPDNRLLARGSRFRMDSEMIRDQILATSGLLNLQMYGRSVKPPQPEGLWKSIGMPSSYPREFKPDSGDQIYRRSIYTFWKRGMPPPQMTILNAPSREACTARRERTNTPLQALLLMNESEYLKAAAHLAQRSLAEKDLDDSERIDRLYETITSQSPDQIERQTLLKTVSELTALYENNPDLANQLCGDSESKNTRPPRLAAWTMLVSTLYNLDVTKTRQ